MTGPLTLSGNLKNVSACTANTLADATAFGLDMPGMLALALTKAYELKGCLTLIAAKTDSADPNLTTLNDVLASLS
jgi:esterase/lipase